MKTTTIVVLLVIIVIAFVQFVGTQGQSVAATFHPPTPQTVSPQQPLPVRPTNRQFFQVNPLALATFTGKFVYVITITIKSTLPTSDVISCSGNADTFDTTGNSLVESASVAAARAGSAATCTVTIPYSWQLAGGGTDMVSRSYTITVPANFAGLPSRLSQQGLAPIHVPPTGSTTTVTIAATI